MMTLTEQVTRIEDAYRQFIEAIQSDQLHHTRIVEGLLARHGRQAADRYTDMLIAKILNDAAR